MGHKYFHQILSDISFCNMKRKDATNTNYASNHTHTQNRYHHYSDNTHENYNNNYNTKRYSNGGIADNDHYTDNGDYLFNDTINHTMVSNP